MPIDPSWTSPPHGLAAIKATFGDIRVASGKVSPASWESANMVVVWDFPGLPPRPDGSPRPLYVNRTIVEPLRAALAACVALGDGYAIRTIGCFAPRLKRVNGDLSTHSWGVAIDINADTNPLAAPGVVLADAVRDMPDAWVEVFQGLGWTWGGRFPRPDPMHYQFCSGF